MDLELYPTPSTSYSLEGPRSYPEMARDSVWSPPVSHCFRIVEGASGQFGAIGSEAHAKREHLGDEKRQTKIQSNK